MSCDLILVLDLPDQEEADKVLDRVGSSVGWVKIGLLAGLATIPTTIILYYILTISIFLVTFVALVPFPLLKLTFRTY